MIMSVASGRGLSVWFAESRRSNVSHESTAVNADILCLAVCVCDVMSKIGMSVWQKCQMRHEPLNRPFLLFIGKE